MSSFIKVKGARVHNLKNISVSIPRNSLTVITGISGSGKSSLAFDTIFAEGQRRYVESLSSYARQFLGNLDKPDVDEITGLSPALSIDQKSAVRSPRSTVGTMSEVYDYLRLMFTAISKPATKRAANSLTISSFSFNSPAGACQTCQGLGERLKVEAGLVIPNPSLSLAEGAIRPWTRIAAGSKWYSQQLANLASELKFSLNQPYLSLKQFAKDAILYGYSKTNFEGVIENLQQRYDATDSDYVKNELEKYMVRQICPDCRGSRLKPEILTYRVAGKNIVEMSSMTIASLREFIERLSAENSVLNQQQLALARLILGEIARRLDFMEGVGLGYLTLDRASHTLAGGEAQRIRLATQLGSKLIGVIYILDEPSIGLHQTDHDKLLSSLRRLRDQGNTVIVVEHDKSTIETADYVVDIGPGAGEQGGQIVAASPPSKLKRSSESITAKYITGKLKIKRHQKLRQLNEYISIYGAREYNLKNITANIPLTMLVSVTGVSGSGKSTLITDTLGAALERKFHRKKTSPGAHSKITGTENIDKVIQVDQSPIGRTPRSNPATYTGLFGHLRDLFARLPQSQKIKYKPSQFSFNLRGGRCENCRGDGMLKVEMHFLPTVYVRCDTCQGKRYNRKTLEIEYRGKTIADVLEMTVDEAKLFFREIQAVAAKLEVLQQVGLGYVKLGQPATTLSGGEAQRIKLAAELARPMTGKTLYILDEPTTGLHFADIQKLLTVLHMLVDKGNSVIVVEHNLDIIANSDWVIDLGPGAGDQGGEIVAQGPPEKVARVGKSLTGKFLLLRD